MPPKFLQNLPSMTPERLAEEYSNGAWDPQVWIDDPHGYLEFEGFSPSMRHQAVEALQKLYPSKVCRELLLRWPDGGLVLPLLMPDAPLYMPALLELGLDLHLAQPWAEKRLLQRLRRRDEFEGASLELSVAAELQRHGVRFNWIPRGKGRTPDFEVFHGGRRYYVEVKAQQPSDLEWLGKMVRQEIGFSVSFQPGVLIRFVPSEEFIARCRDGSQHERILSEVEQIRTSFRLALKHSAPDSPAVSVPPYGSIQRANDARYEQGAFEAELVPPPTPQLCAKRIVETLHENVAQLDRPGRGIMLVDSAAVVASRDLLAELRRRLALRPERYRSVAILIVLTPTKPIVIHLDPKATPEDQALARILGAASAIRDPASPRGPLVVAAGGKTYLG